MKSHNPKAIADKFYGDPFSRKIREGKRCCLFGPSIFKSGYGGAILLIDKESLARYEIYSGMMRYGDLPFLDYENQLGLFSWPNGGGAPIADEEKIQLKQAADLRQANQNLEKEDEKEASCQTEKGRSGEYLEAEQLLFDAAEAEDANNLTLAEDLYRKAIAVLLTEEPCVTRDSFLMLAYSALGHLLVGQKQFLEATKALDSSVNFFQSSNHKQELLLTGTVCVQILAECLTALGRTSELATLAKVIEQAKE
jgi:tetratricopeptide (TPR) repeat protein